MSLNTRNAGALVRPQQSKPKPKRSRSFARMQAAELAWWQRYLDHPTARPRMWALYGARYYEFFWAEMMLYAGRVVEIGCGPVPVVETMNCQEAALVDSLAHEYAAAGLAQGLLPDSDAIRDGWADTVLLLNVLDHTDEPAPLVSEAFRLLRPGGRCLVFVHLQEQPDDKHQRVTAAEVSGCLGRAGFAIQRHAIKPETIYDPPAFVAVAVKPDA